MAAAKNNSKANNNAGIGGNQKAAANNNQKANNNGGNAQARSNNNHAAIGGAVAAPATEASTGPLHAGGNVGNNNPAGGNGNGGANTRRRNRNPNRGGGGGAPGAGGDFGDDMAPVDDVILEDDPNVDDPEFDEGAGATDLGTGDEGTAPIANPADPAQNPDLTGGTPDPGSTDPGDFSDDSGGAADTGLGEDVQPMGNAPTYVVQPGDTLSGIAAQNGMSLSEIEALNPEITNPSLIFPGQSVKIGAASAVTDDMGGTDLMSEQDMISGGGMASDEEFLGDDLTDDTANGAIESDFAEPSDAFPKSSSYPPSENTEKVQAVLGGKIKNLGSKLKGWGVGSSPADPAKKAMYVNSQRDTDPLRIRDKIRRQRNG